MTGRHHLTFLILTTLGILLLSVIGLNSCNQATPPPPSVPPAAPVSESPTGRGPTSVVPASQGLQAPNELGDKVPTVVNVTISDFAFSPATVTVSDLAGAYVIWTNNDTVTHIVRSDDDLFDSGELAQGETYAHLLNRSGTYLYHCRLHPSMTGKIIVIGR